MTQHSINPRFPSLFFFFFPFFFFFISLSQLIIAMTTSHQYNYQDFVPTDALACPICGVTCLSLQDLNTVRTGPDVPLYS